MSTCSSLSSNGARCGLRACDGSDYCGRHRNSSECPVCYDSSRLKTMARCRHEICNSCTKTWLATHNTCPLCRTVQSGPREKYDKMYNTAAILRFLRRWCEMTEISESVWFGFFGACAKAGVTDVEFMGWFESGGRKAEYELWTFAWIPRNHTTVHAYSRQSRFVANSTNEP